MRRVLSVVAVLGWMGAAQAQVETVRAQPKPVLVDNFEEGIGRWFTNDDAVAGLEPATKCALYAVAGGAPGGGKQSARVDFQQSTAGWASVSVRVDGKQWATRGCTRLSLWIRGDGSKQTVRVVLRVQTRQPARDEAYAQTIRLDSTTWENYGLRFFGFRDSQGRALAAADVQHITLLQFAKNGAWPTFRFRVDEIKAEPETVGEEPGPPPAPPEPDIPTVPLKPDFGKPGLPARAQVGFSLGTVPTVLDGGTKEARTWAGAAATEIGPCVVRLSLADYFDPRKGSYNLKLLDAHVAWVRENQCKPLICMHVPRAPAADEAKKARLYALFVGAVSDIARARAKDAVSTYYELFDQPLATGAFEDVQHLVVAYNKLADLIAAADPKARIGGPGFASPWDQNVKGFLKDARRLDFLSFHFYGAHTAQAEQAALFEAACVTRTADLPHQLSFQEVLRQAKETRKTLPEVFVTEFALNSAKDEVGRSSDERVTSTFGAVWLTATALCGTPFVDKLLVSRLYGAGFGMISDVGEPTGAYWAAWILRNYMPRGSQRLELFRPGALTVAATVRTRSALNLIIAHGDEQPVAFDVAPTGLPELGQVRLRRLQEDGKGWTGESVPTSAAQRVRLEGPGVLILQYIPK